MFWIIFIGIPALSSYMRRPSFDDYALSPQSFDGRFYSQRLAGPGDMPESILRVWWDEAPPVRLMLGCDAYSIWESTLAKRQQDLRSWRERGEDTAF